jgi:hypothetical protein
MPTAQAPSHATEQESRDVAEASRETAWSAPSFLRELFLGRFRLDLVHPWPLGGPPRPEFARFLEEFEAFLREEVDAAEIDRTGEYPEHVLDGLRRLGAFGMKIPARYGGLGFTNVEYNHIMSLLGSHCGNLAALLSAHQSIGVPQPLKLFGTEEQKERYLPRCAAGEISAFALTEPDVGSDPARLSTTARPTAATTSSTARSCGPPTAAWPASSWSWRWPPRPAGSAPSSSRGSGRASPWSTSAASWDSGPSPTWSSASRTSASPPRTSSERRARG